MKFKQFAILTVAVVALVSVVTWVGFFQPTKPTGSNSPRPPSQEVLVFPEKDWPTPAAGEAETPPTIQEAHQEGGHNFWFQNDNDFPVQMGLISKNCTCSHVSVALAPDGWAAKQGRVDPGLDIAWQDLKNAAAQVEKLQGILVPAKAGGWVRLGWRDNQPGPKLLTADMWTETSGQGGAPKVTLKANILFVPSINVFHPGESDPILPPLTGGVVPTEVQYWCWSSTRSHFTLEHVLPEVPSSQDIFITRAKPKELSPQEIKKLEEDVSAELKKYGKVLVTPVRSGYSVVVGVRERLPDGRQHDMGPFHATVELKSDAQADPVKLTLRGSVPSDVTVVSGSDQLDRIQMGQFSSHEGHEKTVIVEADPGVQLEVDKDKIPEFMKVELDVPKLKAGRLTWNLKVAILPNKVNGPFPVADDPMLSDTAIYLKTKSKPPRGIRIPVSGLASQR